MRLLSVAVVVYDYILTTDYISTLDEQVSYISQLAGAGSGQSEFQKSLALQSLTFVSLELVSRPRQIQSHGYSVRIGQRIFLNHSTGQKGSVKLNEIFQLPGVPHHRLSVRGHWDNIS